MNFDLTEEQQLLEDSVARFVADHYALDKRIKLANGKLGFSAEHWQTFAELGWLAVPFDEADGGIGGGPVETMVVMEQFGRGLILEPYLATVILGGGVLRRTLEGERRAELLGRLIEGKLQLAFAHSEEQARWDLEDVVSSARQDGDGWVLNGAKPVVYNGGNADLLIVSARSSGGQMDSDGISLFLVDPKASGVEIQAYPTVDGLRAAEIKMTDVKVDGDALLGAAGKAWPIIEAVADEAVLALCAEALGGLEVLYKDTVQYTQERQQFGHPMTDFQTVSHRLVEMFMEYEQCKSLLYRATMEYAQNGHEAARTLSACKHLIGTAGKFIGETAVQLHGGMGVTEELRLGHFFKRQLVIESQFGNADFHLEKFAA
ncbi:MAG: acyl-CoA dehydrogenase family protein [Gammaproteobacteria bacterium]|nr:acyl-CoA dehydrogenase family protein [Gammaproteobacteria bacterium]